MSAPRKIIKRACDGCKVRKIKCSEIAPCDGCQAVGIDCTFNKRQRTRGPRTLRAKTIQTIAQAQLAEEKQEDTTARSATAKGLISTSSAESTGSSKRRKRLETLKGAIELTPILRPSEDNSKTAIDSLVLRLCVYRLRLYPVWPIVAVEEIMAALQRDEHDMETYALANAIGAATIAQLKLNQSDADAAAATSMEAECQRARIQQQQHRTAANLNALRTAFFLHVYHENQEPGGIKSLLYLREAITMAQIMGLHRESTFSSLSSPEQQIRRRILWLLFVTERGVAMLHRLPVVLKPNTNFPSMDGDDETRILPAFQKLINLFWIFDQSGAFDILQNSDTDKFNVGEVESSSQNSLKLLQKRLQEVPIDWEFSNDVQRADICVTRQWMRAVLWKVSMKSGTTSADVTSLSHPIQIAKEFLGVISQLPSTAIEAHGPSMEYKIYEIASAVTDALANTSRLTWNSADRPRDILNQLQRLLASSRGGNKMLVTMLCNKINDIHSGTQTLVEPSSRIEELDEWLSQSTTSPDRPFELAMDCTLTPPAFSPLPTAALPSNTNYSYDSTRQQQEQRNRSPAYANAQEQQMPDFMPQQSWESVNLDSISSLSPSRDLFEQLQSFNGSFNNMDSGTLDRFFSSNDVWDGNNGDATLLNLIPGNNIFLPQQ
ncbi:fungal specific transcription factor [Phlyctema vagabunda]|uniref:Fungal specific transcription factor n=1 Tax=Phlyctema vagabunda TaxID=108571 RepID=A0ABR4P732_9HELO